MGLLSALAGLPLAPLKGLVAIAGHIQNQARQEQAQELADLQAELLELQFIQDERDLPEEEFVRRETRLLEKIGAAVGAAEDREEG